MRSGFKKACGLISALVSMPPAQNPNNQYGALFGEAAKDLTEEEALKIARRLERRAASGGLGRPLPPKALADLSRKNRRRR